VAKSLTVGKPTALIVGFTVPLLVGNLFQQLYSFTDAVVVGRVLGISALAAVGAAAALMSLLMGFAWGMSTGLAIPVARAFGAGDSRATRRAVAAGIIVAAVVTVVVTVVGVVFARAALVALGTPASLLPEATIFLQVIFAGAAVTMAYNFRGSTIRGLGDSRTPLAILVTSCVLNIGLVVAFVVILDLGVAGAALATVVAQFISVVLCLVIIRLRIPELRLRRADWRVSRSEVVEQTKLGLSVGAQGTVVSLGALLVQYAVNGLGPAAVAAFTAASRVENVALAPLGSFGATMVTYVAQNHGARRWRRIRSGVRSTAVLASALAVVLGAVNIVFGVTLVRLFVDDGQREVITMAHEYLIVSGVSYVLLALLFVYRNALQGLGLSLVSTVAVFMQLALRAVAALVLVGQLGFWGITLASPLAWLAALVPVACWWIVERRRLIDHEHRDRDEPDRTQVQVRDPTSKGTI